MADVRILLTDKTIAQLPTPDDGWYLARDAELKGFFVVVGKRKRTFTVQGDLRKGGKRVSSIRVSIGNTSEISTRTARATAKEYLGQISRGQHPRPPQTGSAAQVRTQRTRRRQQTSRSSRRGSGIWKPIWSGKTAARRPSPAIAIMSNAFLRNGLTSLCVSLAQIQLAWRKSTTMSRRKTDLISRTGRCAPCGRYTITHVRRAKSFHQTILQTLSIGTTEKRRDTGMGPGDMKGWFSELALLENPVRREFHLFMLLSGSRPTALQEIKPDHIDFRRRTLHVAKPKGGSKRAFDIPLSREIILCLARAIRFGREMYPLQAREWVFPADSQSGHLAETKEDRSELSKWGNDLRQTFRTIAAAAGVSEIDAKLLMNHSIPGVNAGYITRHKLLDDHLRRQQQAISSAAIAALGTSLGENGALQSWLGRGAARRAVFNSEIQRPDSGKEQPPVLQTA